jgi:uncharacterized protein (DUF983 family)
MEKIKQLKHILQGKCPVCGTGDIFKKENSFFLSPPKMNESCESCHYHFEKEPGYFVGAMYVSYGLAVLEGIITYFGVSLLFGNLSNVTIISVIAVVILVLSMTNYKFSRIIWLYTFRT